MALKIKLSSRYTFVIQMPDCSKGIFVMHTSFILGSLGEERSLLSVFSSQTFHWKRGASWRQTAVKENSCLGRSQDVWWCWFSPADSGKTAVKGFGHFIECPSETKGIFHFVGDWNKAPVVMKTAQLILQENSFYASCYRYPHQEPPESSLC